MIFARIFLVLVLALTVTGPSLLLHAQEGRSDPVAAYKRIESARAAATTRAEMQEIIQGYKALVSQEHAKSAFRLGNIYARGTLVDRDLDLGIKYYRQSVDLGYVVAWRYLGAAQLKAGRGEDAFRSFENAAQNRVTGYEFTAAKAHIRREFGAFSDPGKGIDMLIQLADEGEDRARFELGRAFANTGAGVVDFARSREIFEELAASGDAMALEQLARLYRSGYGVKRSYREANRLYLAAAKAGSERALLGAAEMEIRRGKWSTAKATLERAAARGVDGADMALASGHIRNSFRGGSSKAEGVRILAQGIQNGQFAPVLTTLDLLTEWRRFPVDCQDIVKRAEAAADSGDAEAAATLIRFMRMRPRLVPDALARRAELLDRYKDTLSPRRLVEEQVHYLLDSQRAPASWEQLESKLGDYEGKNYFFALVAADAADERAFVYILQKTLKERGFYRGVRNGKLGKSTLKAMRAFCRDEGYDAECRHGPLRGTSVRLIAASLTDARAGDN